MSPFEAVWCEVSSEDHGHRVRLVAQDARDGFTDELTAEYVGDAIFLGGVADRLSRAARYAQALIDAEYSEAKELGRDLAPDFRGEIERMLE